MGKRPFEIDTVFGHMPERAIERIRCLFLTLRNMDHGVCINKIVLSRQISRQCFSVQSRLELAFRRAARTGGGS